MDAVMMDVDGVTDAGPHWVKVKPEWVSEAMERRFDAALVSVPQLAKAFGISKSSIYAQVRSGAFFIPHRMVGSSPTFTIDDVVTWYMQGQVKQGQRPINRVQNTKSENLKSAAMKLRMDRTVDEMVAEARVRVSPKFID
jgi:predicted DNA-binding transcriptional regulator AlpA